MSIAQDLTHQWFEQVWNQGNEDVIDQLLTEDCIVHGAAGSGVGATTGPDGFKSIWRLYRAAFTDLHFTVERTYTDGDACVSYVRVTGRHTGDAIGPATGKHVDIRGVSLLRANDAGQVIEGWSQFDLLSLYQQLGWIGSPVLPPEA